MKMPKALKRYCPHCKTHHAHKVVQVKARKASSLKRASKYRARGRSAARGIGSMGRYSRKPISKFKRTGKKSSKKYDLRYECDTCKKQHVQSEGKRAKKLEFTMQ